MSVSGSIFGTDVSGYKSPKTPRTSGVGVRATVEISGLAEVVARFKAAGVKVYPTIGRLMAMEGQVIIDMAKERYVPVDTGALSDSGFSTPPMYWGSVVAVDVGFGPSLAERRSRGGHSGSEYAVPVHEIDRPHDFGSWKYLEIPVALQMQDFPGRLRDSIIETLFGAGI